MGDTRSATDGPKWQTSMSIVDADHLDTDHLDTDHLDTDQLDADQLDADQLDADQLDTDQLDTDPAVSGLPSRAGGSFVLVPPRRDDLA